MRVMRSALETRWKATVGETHVIWAMLVGYASFLLNRCEVGHDGKTAYERSKKKVATILGLEFGELIHFKKIVAPGKLSLKVLALRRMVKLAMRLLRHLLRDCSPNKKCAQPVTLPSTSCSPATMPPLTLCSSPRCPPPRGPISTTPLVARPHQLPLVRPSSSHRPW